MSKKITLGEGKGDFGFRGQYHQEVRKIRKLDIPTNHKMSHPSSSPPPPPFNTNIL